MLSASSSSSFFSSSSSSFGGSGAGASTMTRSVTTIEGGRRVTRTTRTVRYGDGREESTTEEQVEGLPPTITGSSRAPAALGAVPAHGCSYDGSGPVGVRVAGSGSGYGASPYTGVAAEAGGAVGGGVSRYAGGYYSDSDDNTPSATYSPSGTAPSYVSASASGYVSGSSSAGYGAGSSRGVGTPLPATSAATRSGAAPGTAHFGAPPVHSSGRQGAAGENAHSTSSLSHPSGGGSRTRATTAAGCLPHGHYTRAASAAAAAPASTKAPPPAAASPGDSSAQHSRTSRISSAAAFSGDSHYAGPQQRHTSRATVSRR
jgi:hypothetical protein